MDWVEHRLFHSRNPAAFGHEIRQQRIFLRGGNLDRYLETMASASKRRRYRRRATAYVAKRENEPLLYELDAKGVRRICRKSADELKSPPNRPKK